MNISFDSGVQFTVQIVSGRGRIQQDFGRSGNSGVFVVVDRLAEVDRIAQLLSQNGFARVARHLQQEETGVTLRQEVIRRTVFIQNLRKEMKNH